jgi:hypothetical protein
MNSLKPHLLGFDVRIGQAETVQQWPHSRRTEYLLSDDVRWPMSVDGAVWPSLFVFDSRDPIACGPATKVTAESVVQISLGLWHDLASMQRSLGEKSASRYGGILVAIELWHECPLVGDPEWDFIATELPATDDSVDWEFVGFDIADRYLVSGLSNCSYSEADRLSLRSWASELNEFGLFDDLDCASRFKRETDNRVPDHVPFFVYGICTDRGSARARIEERSESP